jgi:ParB family chromosome partitioning protein
MEYVGHVSLQQSLIEVNLDDLHPSHWGLRPIDEKVVVELTRSIQNEGLLQPIVARKYNGGYEVVFGCHRLEACRRIGMQTVPTIITSMNEAEAFLARVSENLVRNTYVDPLQEAKGYGKLVKMGWTINAIAKKIGKCDSYVSERISMLYRLDDTVRLKVSEGKGHLTPSHAEIISRVRDSKEQKELAEFVEKKRLSVRALEEILSGAPPPMKVCVQGDDSACTVNIPREYLNALHVTAGCIVHMYVRGNKLILENLDSHRHRGAYGHASVSGNLTEFVLNAQKR